MTTFFMKKFITPNLLNIKILYVKNQKQDYPI